MSHEMHCNALSCRVRDGPVGNGVMQMCDVYTSCYMHAIAQKTERERRTRVVSSISIVEHRMHAYRLVSSARKKVDQFDRARHRMRHICT